MSSILAVLAAVAIIYFGLALYKKQKGSGGLNPWHGAMMVWAFIFVGSLINNYVLTSRPMPPNGLMVGFVVFVAVMGFLWSKAREADSSRRRERESDVVRGSEAVHGTDLQMMVNKGKLEPATLDIEIGGVTIPRSLEAQHILLSGTTGAGKTQALNKILRVIRRRGKRAMIADAGGGFLSRFYQPGDVVFNPFDKRSVAWSPFAEIRAEYDCQRIAKAAIPDVAGESQEWHNYAQTLLAEVMLVMFKRGDHSMKRLLHYVSNADVRELGELLAGTTAAILCMKGNDKMLSNTRGIIATYLVAWRYLPDTGIFSVREWVRNESRDNWLFVTYRDDQMGMLRTLVATMLELGIVEGLSLSENQDRDLWYILDEVDSLGKITSLRAGQTKIRKYGGRFVLGLQTISQLRSTYGNDEAQTLLANASTKLVLRAGDNQTAEYFSKELGEQEVERGQVTHSTSSSSGGTLGRPNNSSSSSTSHSTVRETKATILPSEIMNLEDLAGFLRIPAYPIGFVQIEYEKLPETAAPYEESGVSSVYSGQQKAVVE